MNTVKRSFLSCGLLILALAFVQCKNENKEVQTSEEDTTNVDQEVSKEDFGTTPDGEKVEQYTLRNDSGMEVKIITYGGRITSLTAPDAEGNYEDVVLGFNSLGQYLEDNPFFWGFNWPLWKQDR